tara:strand:+ start:4620 stop:5189 length:570 start_codon:yes stop_codon:yes gene_type:complete
MKCRCPNLSTQNAEFPAEIAHVIRTNENHLQADKQPGIAPNAAFTRHTTELRPPPLRSPSNKQPPMPNNFAPVSTVLTALSRRFSVIEVQRRPRNQERLTLIYRRRKNLQAVQLLGHTKLENTVHYLGIEVDDALERRSRQKFEHAQQQSMQGRRNAARCGYQLLKSWVERQFIELLHSVCWRTDAPAH